MKAMILNGSGDLSLENADRSVLGDGEVMVRVSRSGICGTDLEIFHGRIPVNYPRIIGHEMIGEIVDNPPEGLATGARIIVDPAYFCGTCYQCRAGQSNLCPSGGLIGRDRDGGFADFVSVPASNIFPLPDKIASSEAPLIQVLTTCYHAQRLAPVSPGETVVVIGLGVTG